MTAGYRNIHPDIYSYICTHIMYRLTFCIIMQELVSVEPWVLSQRDAAYWGEKSSSYYFVCMSLFVCCFFNPGLKDFTLINLFIYLIYFYSFTITPHVTFHYKTRVNFSQPTNIHNMYIWKTNIYIHIVHSKSWSENCRKLFFREYTIITFKRIDPLYLLLNRDPCWSKMNSLALNVLDKLGLFQAWQKE